ncbi:hypothetical protein BO71DRAFT_488989 [Aspergillus ellipticus CBS 707.79]|uniref:Uncharacterized protein n=1 Tax=Aspergillus ellipticus CBS 707.79 TaxID=1448320 RepID=A0A319CUB2_9EURO|nr:hypothetical protein BO71DRAFT_488989 [Aspergillus ellipticus CBS 707.79]
MAICANEDPVKQWPPASQLGANPLPLDRRDASSLNGQPQPIHSVPCRSTLGQGLRGRDLKKCIPETSFSWRRGCHDASCRMHQNQERVHGAPQLTFGSGLGSNRSMALPSSLFLLRAACAVSSPAPTVGDDASSPSEGIIHNENPAPPAAVELVDVPRLGSRICANEGARRGQEFFAPSVRRPM